jgi:hypothetical protein
MLGFASTGFAADYADWVAKGYRWSAINGPHAYIKKEDAIKERANLGHRPVSHVIGRAYYLRQGKPKLTPAYPRSAWVVSRRIFGLSQKI